MGPLDRVSMTDLILTGSRAAVSPHRRRRRGEAARRADDAKEADGAAVAARHRCRATSERGSDRVLRFAFPLYRWRAVAAAWAVMAVLVAPLAMCIALRAQRDVPRIDIPVGVSALPPAGTCAGRDYANERC